MNLNDEMRRQDIVEQAVQAADKIILDGFDGSREELLLLTAMVAKTYVEKLGIQAQMEVVRKEFGSITGGR